MKKYIMPSEKMMLTNVGGKIVEGRIIGVIMTVVNGEIIPEAYRFLHNGQKFVLTSDQKFYSGYDELRHDKEISPCVDSCRIAHLTDGVVNDWNYNNPRYCKAWYFDGVKAQVWDWRDNIISYEICADITVLLNGFIPKQLYRNEEDCYAYNDAIIHKDDGTTETKEGFLKRLLLNDEQKELLSKFIMAWKDLGKADMEIIFDRDCSEWSVVSTKGIMVSFNDSGDGLNYIVPDGQKLPELATDVSFDCCQLFISDK